MNKTDQLNEICKKLPDCCLDFLLSTGAERSINTRIAYANELVWFLDWLIDKTPTFCETNRLDITVQMLKSVTSQDISRYLTYKKDEGLMERSVARKRSAISSFFNYLTNNRLIEYNPVLAATKVKVHTSDSVRHLNIEEQVDFLNAVESGSHLHGRQIAAHEQYKARDTALITLLLDTGMRVSELNGLDIGDIDIDKCCARVIRKGGNEQTLYFSYDTSTLLSDYISERKTKQKDLCEADPLFATNKGDRLAIRSIQQLVKKYAVSAIPGKGSMVSPHRLRASFAMGFYHETKDILALQREMGHKSITATNVYAKADDETLRLNKEVLNNARKGTND